MKKGRFGRKEENKKGVAIRKMKGGKKMKERRKEGRKEGRKIKSEGKLRWTEEEKEKGIWKEGKIKCWMEGRKEGRKEET